MPQFRLLCLVPLSAADVTAYLIDLKA